MTGSTSTYSTPKTVCFCNHERVFTATRILQTPLLLQCLEHGCIKIYQKYNNCKKRYKIHIVLPFCYAITFQESGRWCILPEVGFEYSTLRGNFGSAPCAVVHNYSGSSCVDLSLRYLATVAYRSLNHRDRSTATLKVHRFPSSSNCCWIAEKDDARLHCYFCRPYV